mgnify:CR=1 FL=1
MSTCSCIKREDQAFDFVINTYDCKAIIITDLTNWMEGDGYIIPETFDITINLPNKSTVPGSFRANSTTKIFAKDLGGGECLQDGIYCFKVESCGYYYSRNKAVVCTLMCKLDNYISKADKDEDWVNITKLSNLIDSIEINAEMGQELTAKELFKIVDKELNKHSCTCYCR